MKSQAHVGLANVMEHIKNHDGEREALNLRNDQLYTNRPTTGFTMTELLDEAKKNATVGLTLNVVKEVTDSAVAQIARSMPRPVFLTDEGNRELRRKARLLTRFTDGILHKAGLHEKAPLVLRDACVFGTGVLKIYRKKNLVCMDRVHPGEILVNPSEGIYGSPRTMYQRKYVHKDVLVAKYPAHKDAILKAKSPVSDKTGYYDGEDLENMVEVWEGWRLGVEEKAGSHVIAVDGATLYVEDWNYDDFPFIFIHWNPRLLGFWGQGVAESLTGIQLEVNRVLKRIKDAIHLLGIPWVMVENSSKVQESHINNEIGAILKYSGTPPIVRPNSAVAPEVFRHLAWLRQTAFDHEGVSPFLAAGEKPAGLSSGEAIREATEVQSGRFALKIRAYESMYLKAAEWAVVLGKEIAKENPDFRMMSNRDRYTVDTIKWSDVDMDEDTYVLRVFPSSSLPMEPSGRLAKVKEMLDAGLVDIDVGKRLLDFPDIAAETALDRAGVDAIDAYIERILDDGEPLLPEPFFDLQLFLRRGQSYYLKATANGGVPEERMHLLRNALVRCVDLMGQTGLPGSGVPGPGMNGASPAALGPTGAAGSQPGSGIPVM